MTLINEIIGHWPTENAPKLMVLCNQKHWALPQFQKLKEEGRLFEVLECPFMTSQEISKRLKNILKNKIFNNMIGGLAHALHFILLPWHVVKLRKLFLGHEINALFSHNGGYPGGELNRLSVIAARFAGIKNNYMIIHNFPGSVPLVIAWMYWIEDRIIGVSAANIFSVSRACAQAIQENNFKDKEIGVIPNGFRIEAQNSYSRNEPGPVWKAKRPVIMFSGQLHPRKGLDILFDALSGTDRPFSLVLYGKGETEYIEHLKQKAKAQGILDKIYFEGYKPNVLQMIQYCDFLVLPSIAYESFGMALLEAMYWKKTVICSDFGGMKEIVRQRETGLIVPAGDSAALKDAIAYMIDHPQEAVQWGINGYERLKNNFNIRSIAEQYCNLC